MTSYSKSRFILLNVLVIVFTMNAVLAHSACFMDMAPAEQNANVEMNMDSSNMPCHTQDSSQADGPDQSTESAKKECCSACSVIVITVDAVKPITATHTDKIHATLISFVTRTLEIPFRPPINHLS